MALGVVKGVKSSQLMRSEIERLRFHLPPRCVQIAHNNDRIWGARQIVAGVTVFSLELHDQ